IKHNEWIQIYREGQDKAITEPNIQSAWRGAGQFPHNPQKVIRHIHEPPPAIPQVLQSPMNQGNLNVPCWRAPKINYSVLNSRERFTSPVKRYINRLTHVVQMKNAEISITRKQMQDAAEILQARKVRKRGKRVKLEG
ncbi:hypothetical protein V1523DRAFT_452749, partial [Lipomyces doorenjongii]